MTASFNRRVVVLWLAHSLVKQNCRRSRDIYGEEEIW